METCLRWIMDMWRFTCVKVSTSENKWVTALKDIGQQVVVGCCPNNLNFTAVCGSIKNHWNNTDTPNRLQSWFTNSHGNEKCKPDNIINNQNVFICHTYQYVFISLSLPTVNMLCCCHNFWAVSIQTHFSLGDSSIKDNQWKHLVLHNYTQC